MGGRPNTTRRLRPETAHQEAFDLREAARAWCPAALEVVKACLDHKDAAIRLKAADILFDRGHGKAPVTAAVITTHRFAVVPEVMPEELWLERRGQPLGSKAKKPPDAMHDGNLLDLTPEPEPEDDKP
jgi:hypothetical protein